MCKLVIIKSANRKATENTVSRRQILELGLWQKGEWMKENISKDDNSSDLEERREKSKIPSRL